MYIYFVYPKFYDPRMEKKEVEYSVDTAFTSPTIT